MTRHFRRSAPASAAALLLLLAACADDAPGPTGSGPSPFPGALGLVEVTITGIGSEAMRASAAPVELSGPGGPRRSLTRPGNAGGTGNGSIQMQQLSTGSFTEGTRADGGSRYVWASFRLRNAQSNGTAYDTPRQNLTLMAVSTSGSLGGTALSAVRRFDGSAAAAGLAPQVVPTGLVGRDADGRVVSMGPDVLQVFTEEEAASLPAVSGVTSVFPYGFVVRNPASASSRALPASPAAEAWDGIVTFAFRVPLQPTAAEDPFTLSLLFLAVDDTETRLTQSLEEQDADARAAFEARASALGATGVTLLTGGGYTGGASWRSRCDVRIAGTAAAPTALLSPCAPDAGSTRWLAGYYVGYQRGLYPPEQVDFSLMSHLIVGRILPTADGGVLTHFDVDDVQGPAMARTLSTRAHQAGKKAILMLGGSGTRAGFVGAASSANRSTFVTRLLAVMDSLGYDGTDVDWEPIAQEDKAPLLALLQELRARRPGMLLTMPVGNVNNNFPGDVDAWYGQAAALLDRVNVMTYSMSGPYQDWEVWHHSPLDDAATLRPVSVKTTVQRYLAVGVPAAKLGIGMGFYGACWRNVFGPRVPQTATSALVAEDNVMSYANIMADYHDPAAYRWDAAAAAPYLTFATARGPQGCHFVSYEDEVSIAAKGDYVRAAGLGGAIIWTIGQGHVASAPAGSRDPLLAAAHQAFLAP